MQVLNLAKFQGTTYRSVGNVQADYSVPFVEGLKANVNLGYDITRFTQGTFNPSVLHGEIKSGQFGYDYRTDPNMLNTVLETYVNYARPLSVVPGTIDATAGYSYVQSHAEYPSLTLTGLSTDIFGINGFPTAAHVSPGSPNVQDSKLISFFGRLTYNHSDRYLAAVSLRHDGSSRFGPSNAWGTFPSVALAWRLSQEPFLSHIAALSDLKLRVSWARTGNQAFGNYQQYTAYLAGNSQAQVQFGNVFVPTIRPSAVDKNIKWEETAATNVGLDFGFLEQRFSGAIDWYIKKTSDLIFTVPEPVGTNYSNFVTTNIGSMKNQGIEANLSARVLRGSGRRLSWTADFTAAHNANRLTSISANGAQQIPVNGVAGGVGTTIGILEPGQPINSFFVCQQQYQNGRGQVRQPCRHHRLHVQRRQPPGVSRPGAEVDSGALVIPDLRRLRLQLHAARVARELGLQQRGLQPGYLPGGQALLPLQPAYVGVDDRLPDSAIPLGLLRGGRVFPADGQHHAGLFVHVPRPTGPAVRHRTERHSRKGVRLHTR